MSDAVHGAPVLLRRIEKKRHSCCGRDDGDPLGCTVAQIELDGQLVQRMPYTGRRRRCPDCGVGVGEIHHVGCVIEWLVSPE